MSPSAQIDVPLFPLPNLVLFPGVTLPLHIFEERYKTMVNQSIAEDSPFGVILLMGEEETAASIQRVGVLVRVSEVERLDDGRMNILTEGEMRFRIARFTATGPSWRAQIELLDDRPESDANLQNLATELSELYLEAYRKGLELTGDRPRSIELPTSASELSFLVSYVLDMEAEAKQRLLETTSVRERLQTLVEYLKEANERLSVQVRQKRASEKVRGNGDLGNLETRLES